MYSARRVVTLLVCAAFLAVLLPTALSSHAEPPDPAEGVQRYEAESPSTLLVGNASSTGCDLCSGQGKVGGVYDNSGFTLYGVGAPSAGSHAVEVHYISGDPRSADISVNGAPAETVDFPSTGGWGQLGSHSIELDLREGLNTIAITSGAGASPDFDAFDITGALPPPVVGTTFEAEAGINQRRGQAVIGGCAACWGGHLVTDLTGGSGLELRGIDAGEAGPAKVEIHYLGDKTATAQVSVNDGPATTIELPASGGDEVVAVHEVTLPLKAGANTIGIGSASDQLALDRLVIVGTQQADAEPAPTDPNAADPVPRDTSPLGRRGEVVTFGEGDVQISYSLRRGTADVRWKKGRPTIRDFYSAVRLDRLVSTKQYAGGCSYADHTVTCERPGLPTLRQYFTFDGEQGFFIRLEIEAQGTISSNMIIPLAVDSPKGVTLGRTTDERMLLVPVDNDAWVRYESQQTAETAPARRSFEVGAVYDNASRNGLVIGSIERDTWKTGIVAQGRPAGGGLDRLQVAAGLTDWSYDYGTEDNRFQFNRETRPHAEISGPSISSPRVFVGRYDDWRRGMETFGDHVSETVNSRTWDKGTPFGYNSWGGLGARAGNGNEPMEQVSNFLADELPGFKNTRPEATGPYVGIDSYWDKLIDPQYEFERPDADWSKIENYVAQVKANDQEPALYFQPFAHFWIEGLDQKVRGTALCDGCPNQTLRQMALKVNGEPIKHNGAWALDPTNPGVINRGRLAMQKFRELGVRYIKIDFLTHGYVEADDWFDPSVHSGAEAFNAGMKQVTDILGDDMFVDLAISPLFASQFAHARRISCDIHGSMNNWHESDPDQYQKSTENLLNSVTYGWWLDHVYAFNDGDHVQLGNYYYDDNADAQLFDPPHPRIWPENHNRARVTSAVITGVYLISEDFTASGDPELKERAKIMLQNPQVNAIAEIGRTFRPVEADTGFKANNLFVLHHDGADYLAVFNFDPQPKSFDVDLARLGLSKGKHTFTELWSGDESTMRGAYQATVPAEDVALYRITR